MRTIVKTTSGWHGPGGRWPDAFRDRLRRASAGGEDGFLLIEVMVSSVLVALIAVGTFTAFDVSGRITADQRARAQATALAQQDEERLRGLGTASLASLSESKAVTLQNTKYTIVSKSQFVSDATGSSSCTGTGASADYYETTSEVSWSFIKNRPKVIETGLVAPPAGGELVVEVENGRGGKTAGMNITGTGPASLSGTTGSNGCLIFGPLEEGTYTVNASQAGYVGVSGETEPPVGERTASVTGSTTQTKSFEFAQAATVKATLETRPASLGGAQALNVVLTQTGVKNPSGWRQALLQAENAETYNASPITSAATIFPFASTYGVYAGTCLANAPENFGGTATTVQVEPGAAAVPAQPLIEPGMIVLLYKGTSTTKETLIPSPEIFVKDLDNTLECNKLTYQLKTVAAPNTTTGDLEKPGLPYGKYTVCANFKKGGTAYYATTAGASPGGIENNNTTTGTTVPLYEGGPATEVKAGTCP
jgi:Tfp pilus assembly protein PilV